MKTDPSPKLLPIHEPETTNDAELVRRCIGGDESAFVEIVRRNRAKIFSVAQDLLHNWADAEEITQDTFVRAYRNLSRFRGDSALGTWLHRIAVNLARNRHWYFFRRRRHATVSLDCPIGEDGNGTLADLVCSGGADPSQECSRDEFADLVAESMQRLDPLHREILVLRNLNHLSYGEIARRLGINPGTVKSRIARARDRLRAEIAKACPEFGPDAGPADWLEPLRAPLGPAAVPA